MKKQNMEINIKKLCDDALKGKYGEYANKEITSRLANELEVIENSDTGKYYILAKEVAERLRNENIPFFPRGYAGASFVAYLLGITETNPLQPHYYCLKCKSTEFINDKQVYSGFDLIMNRRFCKCGEELCADGHNIDSVMFTGVYGGKLPKFDFCVPPSEVKRATQLKELLTCSHKTDNIKISESKLLGFLNHKICLRSTLNADLSAILNKKTYTDLGMNSDFFDELVIAVKPHTFSDFVRLLGLYHGTNIWRNNVENLDANERDMREIPVFADDILNLMVESGASKEYAYKVANDVRRGSVSKIDEACVFMEQQGAIPYRNIEIIKKIRYTFPKPYAVEEAKLLLGVLGQ